MSAAKAPPILLTAKTLDGRIQIRDIVKAAKKSGLIHFHKLKKEAQPPKHKTQNAANLFSQRC